MTTQRASFTRQSARAVAAAMGVLVAATSPAYAYIDPGTGSMLLQLLLAGVAGALFYVRRWRMFLTGWLFRRKPDSRAAPPAEREPD